MVGLVLYKWLWSIAHEFFKTERAQSLGKFFDSLNLEQKSIKKEVIVPLAPKWRPMTSIDSMGNFDLILLKQGS